MLFTDQSKWNGKIDWTKAVEHGVEGSYLKATGCDYIDLKFKENSMSCPLKYKGAYHFFDYRGLSGKTQARIFLDTVDNWNNLRGALDIEDNSGGGWPKLSSMYGNALKEALQFVIEYNRLTGHYPVIYVSSYLTTLTDTWGRFTFRNFFECPLWVAHYTEAKNPTVKGWKDYAMWQYTNNGDGYIYGNEYGAPRIDLNIVKNLNDLMVPGLTGGQEPDIVTDTEKLNRLWNNHPELH